MHCSGGGVRLGQAALTWESLPAGCSSVAVGAAVEACRPAHIAVRVPPAFAAPCSKCCLAAPIAVQVSGKKDDLIQRILDHQKSAKGS